MSVTALPEPRAPGGGGRAAAPWPHMPHTSTGRPWRDVHRRWKKTVSSQRFPSLFATGSRAPRGRAAAEPHAGNGGMRGPGVLNVISVIAFTLRFP